MIKAVNTSNKQRYLLGSGLKKEEEEPTLSRKPGGGRGAGGRGWGGCGGERCVLASMGPCTHGHRLVPHGHTRPPASEPGLCFIRAVLRGLTSLSLSLEAVKLL